MSDVKVEEVVTPAATPHGAPGPNKTFSTASPAKREISTAKSYDELLMSLGNDSNKTDDLDPEVMTRDVELLKGRIKKMNNGLLNPRSKFMQYWDFFTLSALFYTATITPYEVCLLWEEPKFAIPPGQKGTWCTALFFFNWYVNIIFIIDVCFCLLYTSPSPRDS